MNIILLILFIIFIAYVVVAELEDRKKIQDIPDCRKVGSMCRDYGGKVKMVVREGNGAKKEELERDIKEQLLFHNDTVIWRFSLIVALVVSFIAYFIMDKPSTMSIIVLFLSTWLIVYFTKTYHDYHYYKNYQYRLYLLFSEFAKSPVGGFGG